MIVGFTGTQEGMSAVQYRQLQHFLQQDMPTEFHHGDCVGADHQAYLLVRTVCPICVIVAHPGLVHERLRARTLSDVILPPKPPLVRNREIVAAVQLLYATPLQDKEVLRSGTWATIRYARKTNVPYLIIQRDVPPTTT